MAVRQAFGGGPLMLGDSKSGSRKMLSDQGRAVEGDAQGVQDLLGGAIGGETRSETVTTTAELDRGGGDIETPLGTHRHRPTIRTCCLEHCGHLGLRGCPNEIHYALDFLAA